MPSSGIWATSPASPSNYAMRRWIILAAALQQAASWLAVRRPELTLLVLDALRPQRVQEQLWAALQGTDLLDYIAEPPRGSIHSFGMAVDVTLRDADGRELDMGSGFDDMSISSH